MMARMAFPPLLLLLAFALAIPAGEPAPPPKAKEVAVPKQEKKDDKLELSIPGQILKEDPPDKGRGVPGKVHAVRMKKDMAYVIDLVSADFDSFLRLEDAAGNELAQDDDSGGNLHSRIRFTATKDDTYLIHATSLGGGEGNYTLSVKTSVAVPVKLIAIAAPDAKKPAEVQGKLEANDPPDQFRNQPAKVHTVDLKAGKTYVIDLISQQFDTYLLLQDANAVMIAQDDDGGEGLNSRIQYQPKADGRFRVVATTFNGQVGPFTLRVTEQP